MVPSKVAPSASERQSVACASVGLCAWVRVGVRGMSEPPSQYPAHRASDHPTDEDAAYRPEEATEALHLLASAGRHIADPSADGPSDGPAEDRAHEP